jgi:hypothetical protein
VLSIEPCPAWPPRVQPHPGEALLRGLDQVEPQFGVDLVRVAADLADRLGAALEQPGVLGREELRAVGAAGLLVGQEGQHDVTPRPAPLAQHPAHDGQRHRVHVLHVHGAAAPDQAVLHVAAEGVHAPVPRVRRDHVQMAVHEQRVGGGIDSLEASDDGGAALLGLEDLRLETGLGELLRDVLRGRALRFDRVRRVDADQVGQEADHLAVGGLRVRRSPGPDLGFALVRSLAHTAESSSRV